MKRVAGFSLLAFVVVVLAGVFWPAKIEVWVDDDGHPHLTNEEANPRSESRHIAPGEVLALWGGDPAGTPLLTPRGSTSSSDDRTYRILRGAVDDLGRGETARASVALEEVLERDPNRPEAHWYLALLNGQRGRLDRSEEHLRRFLATAGDDLATWRASAERRLKQIEDERELLRPPEGALSLVGFESGHFRVQMDRALQEHAPDFADRVLKYLEDARGEIGANLGVFPEEATGVVLYGKAAYMRAHAHRFSFQTVGFYDGRIHVVSAAHPAGELRTLLFHEYTHALFQERTGGHRPFWLNEGLAEHAERASRGLPALSRSEKTLLRRKIEVGQWIPLKRLSQSFSGLDNEQARLAYLESTATAAWLERHTTSEIRGYILDALGDGLSIDDALSSVLDIDTEGLERAIQKEILDEFPPTRPAAVEPEEETPNEEETAKPASPSVTDDQS